MPTTTTLTTAYNLIYLLACAVNCTAPDASRVQCMDLAVIRDLSRFHNLSVAAYMAVEQAGLDECSDPVSSKLRGGFARTGGLDDADRELLHSWEKEQLRALFCEEMFNDERGRLLNFCEKNAIWYMPLKGVILKEYYPYPGMRQMGDNDILFDENHREQIRQWFVENGYEVRNYQKGNHDIYTKGNIMFEMHTELFGVQHDPVWRDYYANVKERLLPDEGSAYGYHFKDEDFYIYMTAHAYKHYCEGGVGLRFLLDDYVFLKAKEESLDWQYIDGELNVLGAADFEKRTRTLCRKLFGGNFEPEMLTAEETKLFVEIVQAGTFGTMDSHIRKKMESLSNGTRSGKLKYIWKRLFPDIAYMREYFPMSRHTVLIPFAYIYRIVYKLRTQKDKLKKEAETLNRL